MDFRRRCFNLSLNSEVMVSKDQYITKNNVIATTEVTSDYGGTVRLSNSQDEIHIITASTSIDNGVIIGNNDQISTDTPYFLKLEDGTQFLMHCSPGNKISNSQIIAELIDDSYYTNTGGFLKYSNVDGCKLTKNKRGYEVTDNLTLYWIPEETHEINKDTSLLMVSQGQTVEAKQELLKDLYSNTSGILFITEDNGIVQEIAIKPGYLHKTGSCKDSHIEYVESKIYEPDEEITRNLDIKQTCFIETIIINEEQFLFIRPVFKYPITQKHSSIKQTLTNDTHTNLHVETVQRILYKDGEKIKSSSSINLLKTYLVLNVISELSHLSADIEFNTISGKDYCQLKLIILESLYIRKDTFGEMYKDFTVSELTVKDGDKIIAGTRVAQTKLLCKSNGQVKEICTNTKSTKSILILTPANQNIIDISDKTPQVSEGDLVRYGDQIAKGVTAPNSGQIIKLNKNEIIIRSGKPYLISSGAILQVNHNDLIQHGDTLAILVFERSKTGDIVQGLPRIEEILEARKPKEPCKLSQKPGRLKLYQNSDDINTLKITETNGYISEYTINSLQKFIVSNGDWISLADPLTEGSPNPHEMLSIFFNFYKNLLSLYDAARLSLQKVQSYLVDEVQNVYQSQNVDISDKHIEVIVRQMTSKVRVEDGGDTTLLPGELVELQQIENINDAMLLTKGLPATYFPVLLGITKSSLNTDSFISAASFQETTRVLTEAAIEGKADWLRGLKENVIIGRLIPAGTGFNSYNESIKTLQFDNSSGSLDNYYFHSNDGELKPSIQNLIIDDVVARNYSFTENDNNNRQGDTIN